MLIKTRIANYQNSSPTSILTTIDQLAKGIMAIIHEVALLRLEVSSLHKANEALSKHQRAKRTRVQLGGLLTLQDIMDLLGLGAVGREGV